MTTSEDFNFHRKARPHQGQGPKKKLLASLITPIHNGREFLEEMLVSVLAQTYRPLELVAADDASSDGSLQVLESWRPKFDAACIDLVLIRMEPLDLSNPRGCGAGHARNRAVKASSGMWLINMDCDDICACPQRVEKLVSVLEKKPGTLVGSNFVRIPSDSTPFYTLWCNSLSQRGIFLEQYRECTLICPTWGYSRQLFDDLNGYMEAKAEDLDFFLRHLERGGDLVKVEQPLVYYRFTEGSYSSQSSGRELQRVRQPFLERRVLSKWDSFTIWGCGRDGRRFFNALDPLLAQRVVAFCDIDPIKIARGYHDRKSRRHIPVIRFSDAVPPFIICVSPKLCGRALEENINSLGLTEGRDYVRFC